MNKNTYDWIVIGGGISGISIAEILSRDGKRVMLIEKNKTLSSETSKVFHEWLHSGSLYSFKVRLKMDFFRLRHIVAN